MNERHYHAQSHQRFNDIDTDTIPPNARYWQNSAQDQLCRLQELIGDEPALKMVIHIEGTWRAVYEAIKILADLAEAQITGVSEPERSPLYKWVESNLGKHVSRSCRITDDAYPTEPYL
jgi:hypothetical protein